MGIKIKRTMPSDLGGVLQRTLKRRGLWKPLKENAVFAVWDDVVGAAIAAHITPVGIRNGVLDLQSDSPAWSHELMYQKGPTIRKLNAALGRGVVKDLRFVTPR